MAGTLSIPLTTLVVGTHDFPVTGGFALANSDTMAQLSADRTVAGGLNSLTSATTVSISVFQSNDNGATWVQLAGDGFTGGLIFDRHTGGNDTASGMNVTLAPGTGRIARAEVVIGGPSPVAVQGTLTIT